MFRWLSVLMVCKIYTKRLGTVETIFFLFEGEVDDDIYFTYDTNTEVYLSCTATLNGEMWVLGGNSHEQQVSY